MTNRVAIFTIVSRNYLHYARTLLNSVKVNVEGADFLIGLCDSVDGVDLPEKEFKVVPLDQIKLPNWDNFVFRYTILELNTAIKPFLISDLMDQGYEKVIYFDPDIFVYRSLDNMLSLLDEHQILLTPHLTDLLNDGKMPDELAIMRSGVYNLGYVGLRTTDNTRKLINWWKDKLTYECVVDLERGLFVDQKWMDLTPSMFEGVYINRDPGWNVAYWNLNHRKLTGENTNVEVNGFPLTFFHFSGFNMEAKTLSKHQNRFTKKSAGKVVEQLSQQYGQALLANGIKQYSKISYHYGMFEDGAVIPDMARYVFRENYDDGKMTVYCQSGGQQLAEKLNQPIKIEGKEIPWISALAKRLYDAREDLQFAFPDLTGQDGIRYAYWFVESAGEQANIDELFTGPIKQVLECRTEPVAAPEPKEASIATDKTSAASDEAQEAPVEASTTDFQLAVKGPVNNSSRLSRKIYNLAWKYRHLGRFTVPQHVRRQIHKRLIDNAYGDLLIDHTANSVESANVQPVEQAPSVEAELRPLGVNLIGYVHAESGVGESARASIRSLVAAGLPVAVTDFRVGNISRMQAKVGSEVDTGLIHPINLFHINADQMPVVREHMTDSVFEGRYNIGYWAWELPEFPDEWMGSLEKLDEIWVPSSFCQAAVAEKCSKPVIVMPHSIDPQLVTEVVPELAELDESAYKFLFMFDALSIPARKNPWAVLEAFKRVKQSTGSNAHLILKISNLEYSPEFQDLIMTYKSQISDVILLDGWLTREQVSYLHEVSDCFVSLHRSEGFGLGIAEAMACGNAVIATAWSGNLDFMPGTASMQVPSKLISLDQDYGPYKKGQMWAEPDVAAATDAMIELVNDAQLSQNLGESAQALVGEMLHPATVGDRMLRRLNSIRQFGGA